MIVRNKVFLRKKRDFGDIFGTIFGLLRRNFGVLFGSILLVAGPYIILTAIIGALMNGEMFSSIKDFAQAISRGDILQVLSDLLNNSAGWFVLLIFTSFLSLSFLRTTVANFFVIYETKSEGDTFSINEIARKTYRDVWAVLGGIILFSIITTIIFAIVMVPFILLIAYGGTGGTILFVFVFFFGFLAFGPQLVYMFQFTPYFVMVRDKVFVFTAFSRMRKTIKGNFWWIWVLMVCMFLIVWVASFITNLPAVFFQPGSIFMRGSSSEMFESGASPAYLALYAFGLVCTNIIYCLGDMMAAVSYYSFEEEQTGQGLALKIEEIGRTEENPNYQ